jgi:hypothetical protein
MPSTARYAAHVFLVVACLTALPSSAQIIYNRSINLGTGNGTVNYQDYFYTKTCVVRGKFTYQYNQDLDLNFSYQPSSGPAISMPGTFTINSGVPAGAPAPCPKNGVVSGRPLTLLEQKYEVYVYPSGNTITGVYSAGTFGYINPKYVVSTVLYAPPGSKSTAVYTNSKTVSSSTSVSSTFTSSTTVSTSTTSALLGAGNTDVTSWLNGTETSTTSNTETQSSQSSNSVTLTMSTSDGVTVPGPPSDYVGVDHDWDIIKVWINPVALFTVYNTTVSGETKIAWWGYGSSALDPTAPIDIWGIPAGCLNGDFPQTQPPCAAPLQQFQRTWATNENWPAGQGPGLTQADLNNILAADPWGNCTPNDPVGSSACPNYSSPGFLFPNLQLSDLTNVQYTQGATPVNHGVDTTTSQVQSSSTTTTYSQTYGVEDKLTAFFGLFSASSSESQTLTSSYTWNTSLTTTNTNTGTANIIPPACNGSPCNPVYPPSALTFGTAISFDIFIDERFGTFAFLPSAY